MVIRARILEAAAELLTASEDADISTREVCAAAGVTPPTLYHHFGDKAGLVAAVIDFGWAAFLEEKRHVALVLHEHVADDIRAGWENHLDFARQNPNVYTLMWSPTAAAKGAAAVGGAYRLLHDRLEIGATRGQLRVSTETASRMVMAAVTGTALSVISHPDLFGDSIFTVHLREALIASITVPDTAATGNLRGCALPEPTISIVASTLASKLAVEATTLTTPEQTLMLQWLRKLTDATPVVESAAAPAAVDN